MANTNLAICPRATPNREWLLASWPHKLAAQIGCMPAHAPPVPSVTQFGPQQLEQGVVPGQQPAGTTSHRFWQHRLQVSSRGAKAVEQIKPIHFLCWDLHARTHLKWSTVFYLVSFLLGLWIVSVKSHSNCP